MKAKRHHTSFRSELLPLTAFVTFIMAFTFQKVAAEETIDDIMKGVMDSFSLPLEDLLVKEHPSEWRNLFHGFSGSFGVSFPLEESSIGSGTQGERVSNDTLFANFKYSPISYWFFNTTFYKYLNQEAKKSFNPDFSYAFGYDDWHPYTFSAVFANYGGNRLKPDKEKGEKFTRFEEGTLSIGWKYVIPRSIEKLFIVHSSGGIGGSINYNLTPRYTDLATSSTKEWKNSIGFGLKYNIYKWLYANITFYYYPFPDQQQPWDPDYTYGFGYFDWHPGTITVQYNNYSGNRYPWRDKSEGTGTFRNGSVSIAYSWAW